MRAAIVTQYGPPAVVVVAERAKPSPEAGQVLVRVRAASLNPLDAKLRSGELRRVMPLSIPAIVKLASGDRLLVNGAAGGVGVYAVQIGRAWGAAVVGVASGTSAPLVQRLGVERVIDYTRGELAATRERFDVIFDTVNTLAPRESKRLLTQRGRYVTTGFSRGLAIRSVLGRVLPGRRHAFVISRADGALMREVSHLVEQGKLEAVIDATYPLERIREAYEHLETGHVHGKVVVTID